MIWHVLAAVLFQPAPAPAVQEGPAPQPRPVEKRSLLQDPEQEKGGFDLLALSDDVALPLDPLHVHNNHQLHSIFYIPPMEAAGTLEEGMLGLRYGLDISQGEDREITPRYYYNYERELCQHEIRARYGLKYGGELGAHLDFANLFGGGEKVVLARDGRELVRAGERHFDFGDLVVSIKKRLSWEEGDPDGLSVAAHLKFPIDKDRDNLLSSGGVDFSGQLIYSHTIGGDLVAHLNVGLTVPERDRVFTEEVQLRNPVSLGASVAWHFVEGWAILGQFQGHQSAFEDRSESVEILDDFLASTHLGLRGRVGTYFLEAGVGAGFGDHSSELILTLGLEMIWD